MLKYNVIILFIIMTALFSCTPEPIDSDIENRFGQLPNSVTHPLNNASTPEKVELGRLLFWDPILSGDKDVACVTCHHPKDAYAEQLDLSLGVGGKGLSELRSAGTLVKRNAPTILNTAFNGLKADGINNPEDAPMFWDNRAQSLEEQAIEPILSAEEMRGDQILEEAILDTVINRLKNIPQYNNLFTDAFGENSITEENIGKSIAAFERTLVANNSPFDQYARGDENALSSLEIRGMINFTEVGCANCHNGPMFSNYELHVLTVPENEKLEDLDKGDGEFAFRTPTLRNLALTAPYMHNGVLANLEEVMEFYDDVEDGSQNSNLDSDLRDKELRQLDIPDDKVNSIIAFLGALNDDNFDKEIVTSVPSGLNPGGDID